jgi:hypothetical protein
MTNVATRTSICHLVLGHEPPHGPSRPEKAASGAEGHVRGACDSKQHLRIGFIIPAARWTCQNARGLAREVPCEPASRWSQLGSTIDQ